MTERSSSTLDNPSRPTRPGLVLALVGCALVGWVLVATAWMSDDAFITLRTIDNFVHWHGLRWNVAERVQAFTHPAWLFVLAIFYGATGEAIYTTLVLQIALGIVTVFLLVRLAALSITQALFAIALFVSSKALVDFSTSGLENPLTHLLLALTFICWREQVSSPRTGLLSTFVACAMLCRMETALLAAPVLVQVVFRRPPLLVRGLFLGFLPLVAWEVFSVIYYGALVPNTALAKLATGIPAADLMAQGKHYWAATFHFDPVTPLALGLMTVMLAVMYGGAGRVMALGVIFYGLFVWRAGGDFMSGRFFTPMLMWALLGVVGLTPVFRLTERWLLPFAAAAVFVTGLAAPPTAPLLSGPEFGSVPIAATEFDRHGVTDERRFYYPTMGLLRRLGYGGAYTPNTLTAFGEGMRRDQVRVKEADTVGMVGFAAGPNVHIIDRNALADPLLARLPAKAPWRIGHFSREIPPGYVDTWQTGKNALVDPRLRAFYGDLSEVTQGPLFTTHRFRLIARLSLGQLKP